MASFLSNHKSYRIVYIIFNPWHLINCWTGSWTILCCWSSHLSTLTPTALFRSIQNTQRPYGLSGSMTFLHANFVWHMSSDHSKKNKFSLPRQFDFEHLYITTNWKGNRNPPPRLQKFYKFVSEFLSHYLESGGGHDNALSPPPLFASFRNTPSALGPMIMVA